jgi:hypothetical protein
MLENDVRLNGARVPRALLERARKAAGDRGFSKWIRCAMEEKLERDERGKVRTNVRTTAK